MIVKDLIIKLLDCNPNADVKCVTYKNANKDSSELALEIKTIEDYDYDYRNYVDLILDSLDNIKFSENTIFEELVEKVLNWAKDKDLLHEENAERQFMKFIEEVFEFRDEWLLFVHAYRRCNYGEADNDPVVVTRRRNMRLEMGDILVTLIILCDQLSLDPVECLFKAYEKIKDRKGKTINGTFIKEGDLRWQIYKNKNKDK